MSSSQFSLTTFSSTGKLHQIEYALEAVKRGNTCLGIKARNGVVLASEKKLSSILVDEASITKAGAISSHLGATYSGITADFRVLLKKARKTSHLYTSTYGEEIPMAELCYETSNLMQEYTQSGGVRPFGVSILIAGFDYQGPHLYQLDPSGAYFAWKATAIGRKMDDAKTFLERRYNEDQELEDAIHTALLTLREGFEGEMNENNVELAIIGEDRKFRILTPAEIRDYMVEVS